MATQGYESQRESTASRYTKVLQEGANGIPGIMAVHDGFGKPLLPYEHQRQAVKRVAAKNCEFMLLAHDAGLGKTAPLFQIMAAMEILIGGGCTTIVTVPPSTLSQWEETAHTWLNPDRVAPETILVTNKASLITEDALATVRVLVVSRHLLARLYKTCFNYEEKYEQNERGNWVSKWIRTQGTPLHPLFRKAWDLLGVDECHCDLHAFRTCWLSNHRPAHRRHPRRAVMRNPGTEWCVSHLQLSLGFYVGDRHVGGCRKRLALSATPVFNKPLDMVGLCKAIGTSPEFQDKKHWSMDNKCKTINPCTVKAFHRHTDRVKDDILDLPPLTQANFDFDTDLTCEEAAQYNVLLGDAQKLRQQIEGRNGSAADLQKLMAMLQRMQQMLVSPLLATKGADWFKKNNECYAEAASRETGGLRALRRDAAVHRDRHRWWAPVPVREELRGRAPPGRGLRRAGSGDQGGPLDELDFTDSGPAVPQPRRCAGARGRPRVVAGASRAQFGRAAVRGRGHASFLRGPDRARQFAAAGGSQEPGALLQAQGKHLFARDREPLRHLYAATRVGAYLSYYPRLHVQPRIILLINTWLRG